jgi:glutathione synthase/RimK-type ligase-like ATP-grasp enzyme
MAVLILGSKDDEHAVTMFDYLTAQGTDVELFNSTAFPTQIGLEYEPAGGSGALRLASGRKLRFDDVTSVYWRCYDGVATADLPDPEQAYIAQNDARSLFESFLINLPARWVNGFRGYLLHQTKPVQLAMVAALGVPVPGTLITNDPEAAREFAAEYPDCIFKPVQGGAHTRRVVPRHLTDENLANLAIAPVTLQEEVDGVDVRVFVCGQRVMACELLTGALDFRDDPDPQIEPTRLPDDVSSDCLRIAQTLDLLWTGIDFRRTPDGRYMFFEANPSPMFLGFEARTGLPLAESLAGLLTEGE